MQKTNTKHAVWDCGSSLYDSFELKAFEKQLDSAISSRSMSMPHLSDRRQPPPPIAKKPTISKIQRSLHRLIRSIFRLKNSSSPNFGGKFVQDGFYVDKSAVLFTIPETPEFDGLSPEIRSLVTRTASDRFVVPSNSTGIYCV